MRQPLLLSWPDSRLRLSFAPARRFARDPLQWGATRAPRAGLRSFFQVGELDSAAWRTAFACFAGEFGKSKEDVMFSRPRRICVFSFTQAGSGMSKGITAPAPRIQINFVGSLWAAILSVTPSKAFNALDETSNAISGALFSSLKCPSIKFFTPRSAKNRANAAQS